MPSRECPTPGDEKERQVRWDKDSTQEGKPGICVSGPRAKHIQRLTVCPGILKRECEPSYTVGCSVFPEETTTGSPVVSLPGGSLVSNLRKESALDTCQHVFLP